MQQTVELSMSMSVGYEKKLSKIQQTQSESSQCEELVIDLMVKIYNILSLNCYVLIYADVNVMNYSPLDQPDRISSD